MSFLESFANYKKEIALPAMVGGNFSALLKTIRQGKVKPKFYNLLFISI